MRWWGIGLVALLAVIAIRPSAAWVNNDAWLEAHERLVEKWRSHEPRCGLTVAGYRCSSKHHRHHHYHGCIVCAQHPFGLYELDHDRKHRHHEDDE